MGQHFACFERKNEKKAWLELRTSSLEYHDPMHHASHRHRIRCQSDRPTAPVPATTRRHCLGLGLSPFVAFASPTQSPPPNSPPLKNSALDRLFAEAMHSGMEDYEARLAGTKERLFADATSIARQEAATGSRPLAVPPRYTCLEVGIGTGPNLRYLRDVPNIRVLGLEPNEYMQPYLAAEASKQQVEMEVIPGYSEEIPLEDGAVDLVVCTLVLCSVRDVGRSLSEMARVLKPGGRLLVIEHVRSSDPGLVRLGQAVFNPLQQLLADGCHLDRDAFRDVPEAREQFELAGLERFDVPGLGVLSPHVAGLLLRTSDEN